MAPLQDSASTSKFDRKTFKQMCIDRDIEITQVDGKNPKQNDYLAALQRHEGKGEDILEASQPATDIREKQYSSMSAEER